MRLVPTSRRFWLPWWAVAIVAAHLAMVLLYILVQRGVRDAPTLCWFRELTGHPCPACGSTRLVLALLQGEPIQGFLHNPLVFVALVVLLVVVVLRVGFARRIVLLQTQRDVHIATGLFLLAVLMNWAYLLWTHAP